MRTKTKVIQIEDIPSLNYGGYLWYSDSRNPLIIKDDFKPDLLSELPFVVEGNLWAEKEKVSISIKHINGEYIISSFSLDAIDDLESKTKKFISNIPSFTQYKIYQHWESVTNENCENMLVAKPVWFAFVGLIKETI
jgi:CRISPR type III-associated protein (TIGR04423 family)